MSETDTEEFDIIELNDINKSVKKNDDASDEVPTEPTITKKKRQISERQKAALAAGREKRLQKITITFRKRLLWLQSNSRSLISTMHSDWFLWRRVYFKKSLLCSTLA